MLEELREDDDEPCYGKKCTANEHCCPGSVCVDVDGSKNTILIYSTPKSNAHNHDDEYFKPFAYSNELRLVNCFSRGILSVCVRTEAGRTVPPRQ